MLNPFTLKKISNPIMIRFLLAGVVNTLFSYILYFFLIEAGLYYIIAVTLSTIGGITFNFLNFKLFVYKNHRVEKNGFMKLFISYFIQYILNLIGITILTYMGFSYQLAGALMILPLAIFIYTINKTYIFIKN